MAVALLFVTVAHQRDSAFAAKCLKQAQGELLPVVLDEAVASIDAATFLQLRSIALCKLAPSDLPLLPVAEQRFARPKISHPHVISALG